LFDFAALGLWQNYTSWWEPIPGKATLLLATMKQKEREKKIQGLFEGMCSWEDF
jgi:hypothetical protein